MPARKAGYGEGFVYDPMGQARASYDAFTGLRTAAYVTGLGFGEVLARVDGAGVQRDAVRDRLGSTVGWLDGSGQVSENVLRDAYGVLSTTPAAVVPYGYTGHAEDPTGLVWGRARCYAPTTGAWTSEDPVFTEGRYGYVSGRVAEATDPTGRSVEYGSISCWSAANIKEFFGYAGAAFVGSWYAMWSAVDATGAAATLSLSAAALQAWLLSVAQAGKAMRSTCGRKLPLTPDGP